MSVSVHASFYVDLFKHSELAICVSTASQLVVFFCNTEPGHNSQQSDIAKQPYPQGTSGVYWAP